MKQVQGAHLRNVLQPMPAFLISIFRKYRLAVGITCLPFLVGLGGIALLPPALRSHTFAYQENLAIFVFWAGFTAGLLPALTILCFWWQRREVERARNSEEQTAFAAKQRFLRNLDHELRTPLTTIGLSVENLKQTMIFSDEQAASLDSIGNQAKRLQTIIKGLRYLVEQDEAFLEKASVDLGEVLNEAAEIAQTTPTYHHQSIIIDIQRFPWTMPSLWGDHDCLVIVFRNLIENAFKFSEPGSQVSIRAWQDGRNGIITVADNGCGIQPEDLPFIFEELFRGKNAHHTVGSGLGLASAQKIVRLHGGSMDVDSSPGEGTVLAVRLPLVSRKSAPPAR